MSAPNEANDMWRSHHDDQREFRDAEEADHIARLEHARERDILRFSILSEYHYRVWTIDRPTDTVDFWPRTGTIRHYGRTHRGWVVLMRILGISPDEWMA